MGINAKTLLLHVVKRLGGFRLARRLTANGLRILCYHGIALADEHRFRGRLFMHPHTFEARMKCLTGLGYPIVPLDEAVRRLYAGTLPPAAVVITFDDGWEGACTHALPALRKRGIPVTLYVATYYVDKGTQVFNVTVQYLFWKTKVTRFELPGVTDGIGPCELTDPRQRLRAQNAVLRHGKSLAGAADRQALLRAVGAALEIDVAELERRGVLKFAAPQAIRALHDAGVDIQLHSHRHNLLDGTPGVLTRELDDNRSALSPLVDASPTHFCYPGGIYTAAMWPTLEALGVESATTCESGFNYADTPRYGLRRILDEEGLTEIEFEAELCGLLELWRGVRRRIAPRRSATAHATVERAS
jgi:peptidoglycan/xylan/chitin deacetylase (PgdA/CDA1 family)